jgi:hypothetical protein
VVRGDNVCNQDLHLCFGFGWEIPLSVDLTDCGAEHVVYQGYTTLPTGPLLRHAGKHCAEEGKMFIRQRLRERRRISRDQANWNPQISRARLFLFAMATIGVNVGIYKHRSAASESRSNRTHFVKGAGIYEYGFMW